VAVKVVAKVKVGRPAVAAKVKVGRPAAAVARVKVGQAVAAAKVKVGPAAAVLAAVAAPAEGVGAHLADDPAEDKGVVDPEPRRRRPIRAVRRQAAGHPGVGLLADGLPADGRVVPAAGRGRQGPTGRVRDAHRVFAR
jgi:hypothetical protein